ncbi:MAG: TlpA disulfide reductase family protein [Caldimonas sp.]
MKRRPIVLGAVAIAAIGAGAGSAVWRTRHDDSAAAGGPDVWALSFVKLDGSLLAMSGLRGKPLLINFWATWCVPCVIEMPLLDDFARTQAKAGWNVLALAVDSVDPVRRFVTDRNLTLPVALAGEEGLDLSRRLGNKAGGLPFSVAFDAAGTAVQRKLGAVDGGVLATWASTPR